MAIKQSLKNALGLPLVWKLFNRVVAYPDAAERFINLYIKPFPGMVIADLGCGTAEILNHLPDDVVYYGIDYNPKYIEACRERYGKKGQFLCIEFGKVESIPVIADVVTALGVLHHLTDEEAGRLARLAFNTLKTGGKFVTIDGCYTPNQSWIRRWLLSNDRGEYVRNREGYRALVDPLFPSIDQQVVPGYMRLPYTHNIMVCTKTS